MITKITNWLRSIFSSQQPTIQVVEDSTETIYDIPTTIEVDEPLTEEQLESLTVVVELPKSSDVEPTSPVVEVVNSEPTTAPAKQGKRGKRHNKPKNKHKQ